MNILHILPTPMSTIDVGILQHLCISEDAFFVCVSQTDLDMFHTDLEHMFWGLYTMVLVSLQIKNLEVHYGRCKKIFSSPNFNSKLDQKDNQQFKENKMNDLKSINGEIIQNQYILLENFAKSQQFTPIVFF